MNYVCLMICVTLATPEVTVDPPDRAVVGKPFTIEYAVVWPGAESWILAPPEVAVDGFEAAPGQFEATSENGEIRMTFELRCLVSAAGPVTIPEMSFGYFDPTAKPVEAPPDDLDKKTGPQTPGIKDDALQKLVADSVTIEVRKPFPWMLVTIGGVGTACVLLFVAGFVSWRLRKSGYRTALGHLGKVGGTVSLTGKLATAVDDRSLDAAKFQSLVHRARQHRLDGNYYDVFKTLSEAIALVPERARDQELARRLETRAKEIGFQSARPTDDEMDGAFRALEKSLR